MSRIVLITGVAGGIGKAVARCFRDAGWHVVGVDRQGPASLPVVHHLVRADISDVAGWQQIVREISSQEGRMDALVNNAAIQICKPLVETTPKEWDEVMASNVRSVYLAVRHLHPLMKKQGGSIVNVSSVHAIATSANIAAYAASKGALLALTRALAIELAPERIRVNAVLPGAIDTPMLKAGLKRGNQHTGDLRKITEKFAARQVMGRIGRPEEIAQAVLFLTDPDRSSFMTGQALVVDGGATCRLSTE